MLCKPAARPRSGLKLGRLQHGFFNPVGKPSWARFEAAGVAFRSETDTAVLARLIAAMADRPLGEAARAASGRLELGFQSTHLGGIELAPHELVEIQRIKILSCGSAYIAGCLGAYLIEHRSTTQLGEIDNRRIANGDHPWV